MHARSDKLSAWHRLTTIVTIKGHTDDSAITRLNRMGLTLSVSTKLRLLDEAGAMMDTAIVSKLQTNPLFKVTGDNLDIYIRTGHKSLEKSNTDLHLFASNAIFSRVAKPGVFNTARVSRPLHTLYPYMFFLSGHYRQTMVNSYCVVLGRILAELKEFSWMKSVLPAHIYHPYQVQMSQKSEVFQLPILMKNVAKHEDCVDILDGYETFISDLFVTAFGSEDTLHKYRVPVGGDQLTRVRLEEAKNLRTLATTPKKRFEDLHPFVIELWHTKQDFLEKCYKELYSTKTLRQPGTLYHYKSKLQRTDVNGKVKGAFKSHHDFIMLVGKRMVTEQFIEYFGMENSSSAPTKNVPIIKKSVCERRVQMHEILEKFMDHYGYLKDSCDLRKSCDETDSVYNYSSNLCHWVVNLLNMDDIAKEEDMVRLVPSLMFSLQFFFSHSRLSKYFEECVDFILKCEYMLSPMDRIRVLEGAFTNLRGGIGCNIESDLVQENSVRNQKDLIRSLGANKTDKAIMRCTKAADIVVDICDKIDSSVALKKTSSRHHTPRAAKDEELIAKSLRELRPFSNISGRTCQGLPNILSSPLKKIDQKDLKHRMNQVIERLFYGQTGNVDNALEGDD
ncbi:uncharacterized protein LOC132735396 [Ruditapes philippinarum]|uniref:uncharacterized protein LOC132735396 n=1 Tax=Ruditapes philippinarum TaxID=129788 RepID=UPI00295B41A1|nr:uncharacterized protein LOC132735396 [Ruditapes philippinarum]